MRLRGGGVRLAVASIVCLLLAGCGGQQMPTTKVTGKITFDGGPPPTFGTIAFSLVPGTGAKDLPYRPGSSPFGKDGTFVVNSFGKGDGLLPGTYRVRIDCFSGPPGSAPPEEISHVPLDWKPDNLVITGDEGEVTVEYNVPPKKPNRL